MIEIKTIGKIYRFLTDASSKRFLYLLGGAGAGKSWSVALRLVHIALQQPGVGILCTRKTKPAVRSSCLPLIRYYLDCIIPGQYREHKGHMIIRLPNGSVFRFDSLDDIEKKKSMEGINYWWAEETTELNAREFMRMNLTVRAKNRHSCNQVICSFNPIDPVGNEWLKNLADMAPSSDDSAMLHVTYLDNTFLDEDSRREIEKLAGVDAEYDSIYRKGEWATPTGIIFSNWDIVDDLPAGGSRGYGLDFGFNNPAALIAVVEKDQDIWLDELVYERGLTNADLMARFNVLGMHRNDEIIADCAEPKAIEEIGRGGWNIHPCVKGEDSVRHGIRQMKQRRMHITRRSTNLLDEIRAYKWRVNRAGQVLDDPVDFNNHAMDAIRYKVTKAKRKRVMSIKVGQYGEA